MIGKSQKRQNAAIEKIEDYIIENELKAGDKLPSERHMVELWGFNRTTLRFAIRYLSLIGVLDVKKGSGTFIAPRKLVKNLQDAKGTFDFAKESSKDLKTKVLAFSKEKSSKKISTKMNIDEGAYVYKLARLRYLDGVPVTYTIAYLNASMFKDLEDFDFNEKSLYTVLRNHYGLIISGGEEVLNISYCDEYESEIFGIEEGSALIYQTGTTKDCKGVVFEYFEESTRSEYIVFASELKRVVKEKL